MAEDREYTPEELGLPTQQFKLENREYTPEELGLPATQQPLEQREYTPEELGLPTEQKPQQESSWARRWLADPTIAAAQGIIGLKEAAVGIADIPTFGVAGKIESAVEKGIFGGTTEDLKNKLQELKTPEQLAQEQAVQEAKGFTATAKALLQNPSALTDTVIQSIPSMIGGAGIARGGIALATKAGKTLAPVVAGAVGEGVVAAGAQAEDIRKQTESGYLSPQQAALSTLSGTLTSGLGLFGGRMAQKLGLADVETLLAGGTSEAAKKSLLVQAAKGALAEGALEELPQSFQEQMLQNIALGKDPTEGVAEAAATGLLSGGVMGGGTNFFSQLNTNLKVNDQPPPKTTPPSATDPKPLVDNDGNQIESQIKPPTTPETEEKPEQPEVKISESDASSNPLLGIGAILLQGEQNARLNRRPSRRSVSVPSIESESTTTQETRKTDGVPVVSTRDDARQLNEREAASNATLVEEKAKKDALDKTRLQNSIFTDSSEAKVQQYKNKAKLADTHTVEQFQEAEDGPTYYALVPKKQLRGTNLQNVLTELTLYDAPKTGKKYDFTKPIQVRQYLEAKIDKKQLDELKQDPKVFSKLAKQYKNSVINTSTTEYTQKQEAEILEDRRNKVNTIIKENPNLQNLPADLNNDFVKAGIIDATESPMQRSQDPIQIKQIALDDLAFEQAQDEITNSNTEAIDKEIQAIAEQKGLKAGEYSIYNPLQFMTAEEFAAIQNKHINTKKPTSELIKRRDRRQEFFDSLTPEEQSIVDTKYRNYLGRGLVSRLERASGKVVNKSKYTLLGEEGIAYTASEQKIRQEDEDYKDIENQVEAQAAEKELADIRNNRKAIKPVAERVREDNKVRQRINNRIIEAIKEGKTLAQILDAIATTANEFNKTFKYETIAAELSKFVGRLYTDPKTKKVSKNETKVVLGTVPEGRTAMFDPATGTITIDINNINNLTHLGQIMVHETMHATMDHIVDNQGKLSSSQLQSYERLERIYKHVLKTLPKDGRFQIENMKEFIAEVFANRNFQLALADLPPRPGAQFISLIRDIARAIAGTLGLKGFEREATVLKDAAQTIESIMKDNGYAPPSIETRAASISFAPKQAEDMKEPSFDELVNRVEREDYVQRGFVGRSWNTFKRMFGSGQKSIDFLVKNFQNSRYAIKKWQDDLEKAGLLKVAQQGFNNIFDKITTAFGQADLRFKESAFIF